MALLVGLACAAACETAMDADLLRLDGVDPERLEPGARLRVGGAGFPAGRAGVLRLDGTVRSPGERPRPVTVSVRCRAASDEAIEAVVDDALLDVVGGRATFQGALRVEFGAAGERGVVTGRLRGVTLDFLPAAGGRLDDELDRRRDAEAWLAALGVTPSMRDGGDGGLLIGGVHAGSPAAEAGLLEGDRIVAVEGVRIAGTADFVPPPGARRAVLEVARAGEAGTFRLGVPVSDPAEEASRTAWIAGAAIVGLALALVLFLSPAARLTASFARVIAGTGRAPSRPARQATPGAGRIRSVPGLARHLAAAGRRAVGWACGMLAATVALGVLPLTARVYTGGVDVGILLFAAFAARLVMGGVAPEGGGGGMRARAVRIGRFLLESLPAAAAASCIVAFSGTLRLAGIVAAQAGAPWEWYALRNPIAFVMFPVFVVAALGAGGRPGERSPVVAQVADRAQRFVMAGLATALFLGGWKLPWVEGDPLGAAVPLRLLGTAAFVAKAWLLLAVSERIPPTAGRWRWTVPVSITCAAVSASTLLVTWPPQIEQVGGPVLAALAALLAVHVLVRRRCGEPPLRAMPFL